MHRYKIFFIYPILALFCFSAWSAGTSLDEKLRIKRLFIFPGYDVIHTVVTSELDKALIATLNKYSRFEVIQNPDVIKALSPDADTYLKSAQSPAIHREATKITKTDATVWLSLKRIGKQVDVTEEWREADGTILFSESRSIASEAPLEIQKKFVAKITEAIIDSIPFKGSITGRTKNILTLDLGNKVLHVGDEVEIARLVSEQRHPLLKTLVNIDYVKIGKAKVTSTDPVLSFAEVEAEKRGEIIEVDNKIINIIRAQAQEDSGEEPADVDADTVNSAPAKKKFIQSKKQAYAAKNTLNDEGGQETETDAITENNNDEAAIGQSVSKPEENASEETADNVQPETNAQPETNMQVDNSAEPTSDEGELPSETKGKTRFGKARGSVLVGPLSHEQTVSNTTLNSSAFGYGGALAGELWLTKNWILAGGFDFLSANLSGTEAAATVEVGSTSWNKTKFYGGYRLLLNDTISGNNVIFGLGYQWINMNLPEDYTRNLGKKSFSGPLLKVEGDIALEGGSRVNAGFSFQPFSSITEVGPNNGVKDSATTIGFNLAWNCEIAAKLWFWLGLEFDSSNASFQNGNTISERRINFGPGIVYGF